jgi:hypothetical protein
MSLLRILLGLEVFFGMYDRFRYGLKCISMVETVSTGHSTHGNSTVVYET